MGGTNAFDIIQNVADKDAEAVDIINIFSAPFDAIIGNSLFNNFATMLESVGIVLMLIYFFVDLEDIALRQSFTIETFVKNLAKLVVGLAVILNIGPLMTGVNNFGNAILADLASYQGALHLTPTFDTAKGVAQQVLKHTSQSEKFDKWIMMGIVGLFQFITQFVLWVVAIKRAIEIGIYYAFAPIIYADVFSNGLAGVAQKLKPLIGAYMQLPYVMILMSLGSLLIEGSVSVVTTTSSIFLTFVVLKSVLGAVSHSRNELDKFFSS